MRIFSTVSNTWRLAKISWAVLRKDRELLLIPLIMLFAYALLGVAHLIAYLVLSNMFSGTSSEGAEDPAIMVLGITASLITGIISVFCQGALIAGAYERLMGYDPTVRSALSTAMKRADRLIFWGLITTTVGLLLRALQNMASRSRILELLLEIVKMSWSVVSFLTVPAIVISGTGPINGLKRSVSLLRKTWGENLIAQVGFGWLASLLSLPGFIIAILGFFLPGPLLIIGLGVGIVWVLVVSWIFIALNAIYQAALYVYATADEPMQAHESDDPPYGIYGRQDASNVPNPPWLSGDAEEAQKSTYNSGADRPIYDSPNRPKHSSPIDGLRAAGFKTSDLAGSFVRK